MPSKTHAPLTADFVKSILDYDPKTGFFLWQFRPDMPRKWNSRYVGKQAGSTSKSGYVKIQIGKGMHYSAHVLAWLIVYGEWLPSEIDHKFGDRSDNRISELRRADTSDNACNKVMQRNNTSGFVGVSFDPQRKLWRARVKRKGKMHDLGFYSSADDAAAVRAQFIRNIHGEFAVENPDRQRYPHQRDHNRP